MRLEDLKKEIPETPAFIHEMVEREVEKQLRETRPAVIRAKGRRKWYGIKVAAALLCVLAASTAVYAGTKLYRMFVEKEGAYGVTMGIQKEENGEENTLPAEVPGIEFIAGYIPEGMTWSDAFHLEYPEHEGRGGFSFSNALLDEDCLEQAVQERNVEDSEKRTFGSYEGVYLRYHTLEEEGVFNQRIYLLCPELYRVITIYIGGDVTKEEAVKVAENLEIAATDQMLAAAEIPTWREVFLPEEYQGEPEVTSVEAEQLPVYQIGENFTVMAHAADEKDNALTDGTLSVRVDSVQTADDLQLLDPTLIPAEWTQALGADGKLMENTLSYIRAGDGLQSVDEVVRTEEVGQKLVYATVTYTNSSEKELHHILYVGSLVLMNQESGDYQIYVSEEQSGEDYDYIKGSSVARRAEMAYSSVSEDYGNGGNYIPSLKPGESIEVNMAWIVNETDLANLYLDLSGSGASYCFSDAVLETGLVDVRQQ